MKITMTPTDDVYQMEEAIPCRAWEGVTEKGTKVRIFVIGIEVPQGEDTAEFEATLQQIEMDYRKWHNSGPDTERN